MKVIFLDVDGVLNSEVSREQERNNFDNWMEHEVSDMHINNLKKIVDATGAQIRIEYSTDGGNTWTASQTVITIDSYEMQTYRVKLPEGVKRVAIVLVEGTGRRVNFDDIKLMK